MYCTIALLFVSELLVKSNKLVLFKSHQSRIFCTHLTTNLNELEAKDVSYDANYFLLKSIYCSETNGLMLGLQTHVTRDYKELYIFYLKGCTNRCERGLCFLQVTLQCGVKLMDVKFDFTTTVLSLWCVYILTTLKRTHSCNNVPRVCPVLF